MACGVVPLTSLTSEDLFRSMSILCVVLDPIRVLVLLVTNWAKEWVIFGPQILEPQLANTKKENRKSRS